MDQRGRGPPSCSPDNVERTNPDRNNKCLYSYCETAHEDSIGSKVKGRTEELQESVQVYSCEEFDLNLHQVWRLRDDVFRWEEHVPMRRRREGRSRVRQQVAT